MDSKSTLLAKTFLNLSAVYFEMGMYGQSTGFIIKWNKTGGRNTGNNKTVGRHFKSL